MNGITKSPHWTQDDLLNRMYGLDTPSGLEEPHLTECEECSRQWADLVSRRAALNAAAADVSDDRLRAQRQAVWARIEHPRRAMIWRAMPAVATALMLFIGISLQRGPAPEPAAVQVASTISDEQLFTEIASVVNQDAPRAADPIRGLFSEEVKTEAR